MQPRLLDARQLLAENKVRLLATGDANSHDFAVAGSDVVHHVRLRADRDRCSCPWFSKLQGERGPCKSHPRRAPVPRRRCGAASACRNEWPMNG
jgi:hypothetical protein